MYFLTVILQGQRRKIVKLSKGNDGTLRKMQVGNVRMLLRE